MPELRAGSRHWEVAPGSNLLDALNGAGLSVPYSCRAGSCHACLVRCVQGEPDDALPEALAQDKREQGWRLACQCRVASDLVVEVFDPLRDGLPAQVASCDWPAAEILRLRLTPERPLRYRAGQHLVLWLDGVARPYSLASLPGEDPWLEFHIDCRHPGQFADRARLLRAGDEVRLGELRGGALHYDPDWQERPLWLMAAGTGLAPLWGLLREALRQSHQGPILLWHVARTGYLQGEIQALLEHAANVQYTHVPSAQMAPALAELKPPRQAVALLCGGPERLDAFARRLFMAGLPRRQVFADAFVVGGSD
jgi:NAD(P)H-flavin reductase/ferredoxin